MRHPKNDTCHFLCEVCSWYVYRADLEKAGMSDVACGRRAYKPGDPSCS